MRSGDESAIRTIPSSMADEGRQQRLERALAVSHGTVGVLVSDLDIQMEQDFVRGVMEAAAELDISVLCFVGGTLGSEVPSDTVFSLPTAATVDGVIISGPVGHLASRDTLRHFCDQYAELPVVTWALDVEGLPQVVSGGSMGVHAAVSHLVEVHGYRRIAFIQGPKVQSEARDRYQAYVAALDDHGILVDESLVKAGDYLRPSGAAAMRALLDGTNGPETDKPGKDTPAWTSVDAVVCANDEMLLGAYDVLMAQGIRVPEQIALVGFDDISSVRYLSVPMTTVRQSFHAIGRMTLEALLRCLADEPVAETIAVPAELIVRRSCGCPSQGVIGAAVSVQSQGDIAQEPDDDLDLDIPTSSHMDVPPDIPAAVWDALVYDVTHDDTSFLSVVESQLPQSNQGSTEPSPDWQDILSSVRRHMVPCLSDGALLVRIENLLHQGRVLVANATRRKVQADAEQAESRMSRASALGSALAGTVDVTDMLGPLRDSLPQFNIDQAYVVLGDRTASADGPDLSRLAMVVANGEVALADETFASHELLPSAILPRDRHYAAFVLPLWLRDRFFGWCVFLDGPTSDPVYQRIAEGISGVLFRSQLLQSVEVARRKAETSLAEIHDTRLIADRIQQAPDEEAVLRIALEELSRVLGASTAAARLGTREQLTKVAGAGITQQTEADD